MRKVKKTADFNLAQKKAYSYGFFSALIVLFPLYFYSVNMSNSRLAVLNGFIVAIFIPITIYSLTFLLKIDFTPSPFNKIYFIMLGQIGIFLFAGSLIRFLFYNKTFANHVGFMFVGLCMIAISVTFIVKFIIHKK